jgi:hypothetical protein
MARLKLTKRTVESLKVREKDHIAFDVELPGFGVRVMPSGKRFFLIQYRRHGRTRRVMIGQFGPVTAENARREWRQRTRARSNGSAMSLHIRSLAGYTTDTHESSFWKRQRSTPSQATPVSDNGGCKPPGNHHACNCVNDGCWLCGGSATCVQP